MTPPRLPTSNDLTNRWVMCPLRWLRAAPEPPIQRRSRKPRNAQLEGSAARHVTVNPEPRACGSRTPDNDSMTGTQFTTESEG
jgi:hypothetical protein